MSTSKVDAKKRVVLPDGKPGDVFDIQRQGDGRYLLVRLERPTAPRRSKAACLRAMSDAPLNPTMSWEQLKKQTREP